jgi:hypothetical protein
MIFVRYTFRIRSSQVAAGSRVTGFECSNGAARETDGWGTRKKQEEKDNAEAQRAQRFAEAEKGEARDGDNTVGTEVTEEGRGRERQGGERRGGEIQGRERQRGGGKIDMSETPAYSAVEFGVLT